MHVRMMSETVNPVAVVTAATESLIHAYHNPSLKPTNVLKVTKHLQLTPDESVSLGWREGGGEG
jgi:hypothetical protein